MNEFDCIISGAQVVTEQGVLRRDVAVKDGKIAAIDDGLEGERQIDATDRLLFPGGIDSHCHIEQETSTGLTPCDDFYSASVAAACGGTTTLIPFACQHKGQALREVVRSYHDKADGVAGVDYAFHLIVSDPTRQTLGQDLPALIHDGYTSFKIYMTYDRLRLADRQILDVLDLARREQAMVMIHAESHDIIQWLTERLLAAGRTAPSFHRLAHHDLAEREASHRAITMAELLGSAVLLVHVSGRRAAEEIRKARVAGAPIFAETCPQYLVLTGESLEAPGFEGAKYLCSPPLRDAANQAALWEGLRSGVFDVVSSDHSAYRFADSKGKMLHGEDAPFNKVPMGLPGLEARLPLLFSEGVRKGRISLERFAELSATNHAKLYGLYPRKGVIAEGSDADLVLWDPQRKLTLSRETLHDDLDYTPYEGIEVEGVPVMTMLRGEAIYEKGEAKLARGFGRFLPCERPSWAAQRDRASSVLTAIEDGTTENGDLR